MLSAMSSPDFAMLSSDDLVTGEAVALDLPPASVAARIASGLLDVLSMGVVGFCVFFLFMTLAVAFQSSFDVITIAALLIVAMIGFGLLGAMRNPPDD